MKPVRYRGVKAYSKDAICSIEDCSNPCKVRGWCSMHYARWARNGDPLDAGGRIPQPRKLCSITDGDGKCLKNYEARGMCRMHYRRWSLYGDATKVKRFANPVGQKYKMISKPGHPNARPNGRIMEHRFVMAEILGRPLTDGENVHHINGDRFDNRVENLELWNTSQPSGQRVEDKVNWALEMLALYAPDKLRIEND